MSTFTIFNLQASKRRLSILLTFLLFVIGASAQQKTPNIIWSTPAPFTYGTALSKTQLNASAVDPITNQAISGKFVYSPPVGTVLNAGTQTLSTTFTPNSGTQYITAAKSVQLVVNRQLATITISNIKQTYDGNPKPVTVTTSPAGLSTIVTYTGTNGTDYPTSTTAPASAGTYSVVAKLNNTNYTATDVTATLTITQAVAKINPVITWSNPALITYGTALSKKQLNATANVSGTFVYKPPSGTVLNAGSQTLSTTFTPTDATLYNTAAKSVILTVDRATSTVTLSGLTHTYDGSAKAATATTTPAGLSTSITYNGSTTAPINAGSYAVVATITDSNYSGSASGTLVIGKATATLTLSNLTQSYNGSAKSATVTTSPAGLSGVSVTYDGSTTAPSAVGSYAIVAALDNANYQATNATGTLEVNSTSARVTLSGLTHTYDGSAKAATATTTPAGLSTSITYNGSTTAPINAGSYAVVATITDSNYSDSASGTLVIGKATPLITWSTPAAITYGTTLSSVQLNATANVAGTIAFSPAAGTVLNAGNQTLRAVFTPSDATNYVTTSSNTNLNVGKASLLIRADDKTKLSGAANPTFTASYLGKKVKVVVLGSSTAAGAGVSLSSKAWVNLLTSRLATDYPGITSVENRAIGGLTTYQILPTGTVNSANRPAVNTAANITAALQLNPQIILINMPSNDVAHGFSDEETLNNYRTVINLAQAAGVKVFLTGTQPRGDISLLNRQRLQTQNQVLLSTYGVACVNIYDELVDLSTYGVKSVYNSGDNLHVNDAGHNYIYTQISPVVKNWIETQISGLVNGDTPSSLSGTLWFSTTATATSTAGTYPIAVGGQSSGNYQITYQSGNLTVTNAPAALTTMKSSFGVSEISLSDNLEVKLWPNPFIVTTVVELVNKEAGNATIELYDQKGAFLQRIYAGQVASGSVVRAKIDARMLANGTYFIIAKMGKHMVSKKVIVQQ
jgi:hypothetical protein